MIERLKHTPCESREALFNLDIRSETHRLPCASGRTHIKMRMTTMMITKCSKLLGISRIILNGDSLDMMVEANLFILAADSPSRLLQLLEADHSLASSQDDHGYSLIHAAASYNHLDLLRKLVLDYKVDVNIKDEDGDTALCTVETVDAAKLLVEELHIDLMNRGEEGKTAGEKIAEDGEFKEVAVYLRIKELEHGGASTTMLNDEVSTSTSDTTALPDGMSIDVGSMNPEDAGEVVDPEFRRRIEELAAREDFQTEEGQLQLRELVTEALRGDIGEGREVRRRVE